MTPSLLIPLLLAAATDKLPPANALPPPDNDTAAVLASINALFAGMAARDGAAILAQVRPDGRVTQVVDSADGNPAVNSASWAEFAERMKASTQKLDERITNPAVDIDGDIAMVWSPYVFFIDGKLSHCGVDHFDLVREGGRWRIFNITYSKRTTGCPAQ